MARPVPLMAKLGKCIKEMESHAQGGQSMLDQHQIRPPPCVQCPSQARSLFTSHHILAQCKHAVLTAGGSEARMIKHLQDCVYDQQ